jgi:hypothetical protein
MPELSGADLYQKIDKNSLPSFQVDGRTMYVVECDLAVDSAGLKDYCDRLMASKKSPNSNGGLFDLTSATIKGRPMRWKAGTELKWFLDRESFTSTADADKALGYTNDAADVWNAVAINANIPISFLQTTNASDAVFSVSFKVLPQDVIAVAFFPHDPPEQRVVYVSDLLLNGTNSFSPTGVMRHELGHVLGFRHEHIRPESPKQIESWVVGNISAQELTSYDRRSVMHYPLPNFAGYGTTDFQLTNRDKDGFKKLYQLPADQVQEYAP